MFTKSSEEKKFYLRSFQVCSNQFIRGLVTSDIEYNVSTFPKELALRCKQNEEWFKEYGWITIGKTEGDELNQDLPPKKADKPQRPKSVLRNTTGVQKGPSKGKEGLTKKKVAFTLDKNEIRRDVQFTDNQENIQDITNLEEARKSIKEMNHDRDIEEKKAIEDELYRMRDSTSLIERTKQEIEEIKRQYEIELYGKPHEGDVKVSNNEKLLIQRHPDPQGSDNPDDVFLLRPDPIMRLNQCIGSHPKFNSQSVLFHRNPKFKSDVVYGTANMIVSMNTKTMKQRFLFDHTDHVRKITMTTEFIISASKPGNGKSDKGKKKRKYNKLVEEQEIQIIVWDVHTGTNLVSFKPPIEEICDLFVTLRNSHVVIIGKDYQGRDLVLSYNFPDMVKFAKVDLVHRQLSDFTIQSVTRNPINDAMFVTGGKESIRFWKISSLNNITGSNVILNKVGRGKEFVQILFDFEFYGDDEDYSAPVKSKNGKPLGKIHWVYAATSCGHLFQISYPSKEIEQVIKIHEDRVTSLIMTNDRRYSISSSLDGTIRLFTVDFSQ